MLTKVRLLEAIKDMPDQIVLDDLLNRILLLQKIEIGLEQSESGQVKTTEGAKEILKRWLL
jgi:hypothetical protein